MSEEEIVRIPFEGDTRRRRRIGVMGGTFDPIHHGHLVAASEVQHVFDLDEVIFVPTGRPAFKQDREVAPAEHRYLMAVIATASNDSFTVSRVDIERPGLTYAIDTLHDIRNLYPDADLFFITGADAVKHIIEWKSPDELWKLATFVAVTRPGHSMDVTDIPADAVKILEVPALAISSTDIRERVAQKKPIWYLVPDGVVQHIRKYNLYRR